MPFNKYGEASAIKIENTESCIPDVSPEQLEHWRKYAANLKMIAPKADDFLYFSAVMMHAAEAAALNDDGTIKLTAKGEPVQVGWDKGGNTWKWISNDASIKPYKNSNGDIFPEEELTKAYKKWVHKPLCVDHKSSSVEHTRGFIVDTYYDRNLKRVIALCALDKANYPALAKQISTGVSNCVSMGTAVGRAICTDCARVARTEQDFCAHMRNKTCYGEINVDLNPIELSIVMNGADQRATIKHIIAAASTMNTYLENKQKELEKLAEGTYTASITFENKTAQQPGSLGSDPGKVSNIQVTSKDLDTFKTDVAKAIEDYQKLQASFSSEENKPESGNVMVSNQSSGSIAMDEGAPTDSGLSLQTPQTARFASAEQAEPLVELQQLTKSIEDRLSQIKEALDKLEKQSINTQEEHMSGSNVNKKEAYFQGAGGVNEPTPGQVKYPKDPLNEELREKEDKQMVGQPPFPEVGPVDGMHPSPASADPSDELQRKKMLARAQVEEARLRREAIVNLAKQALENKQGYIQGGGGVNEPTPGKPKYTKDPLNEELRDNEDKQMVGQPPFPGVGPVDGLHPSPASADPKDELKRKQMLARASLRGRFVYAHNADGSSDKANSAWEVYLGDKLLLAASVSELAPGRVEELYDGINTKEFGAKLLEKIKVNGATAVSKLLKQGQEAPPPPAGGDMGAPPADMGAPTAEPASAPPAEDTGKSGDPKATAMELAEKVRDLGSDLVEAVRALTGEQAEMGMEGGAGAAGAPAMADDSGSAKSSSASLNTLRKELNAALIDNMKEAIAELKDSQEELDAVVKIYDKGVPAANLDFVNSVVEDSLSQAKSTVADAFKLMTAFVKYANGTRALVKRAEMEQELTALGAGSEGDDMSDKKDSHSADGGDLMDLINDTNADLDLLGDDNSHVGEEPHDEALEHLLAGDANDTVQVKTPAEAAEVTKANPAASVKVQASFDTVQGRLAMRTKLAADALGKEDNGEVQDVTKLQYSDMLDQADRLADGQTHLDVKPSNSAGPSANFPLGLVETPEENMKAMLEVAKAPPKVRKEAEAIQRLVAAGELNPADLDALVAEGLDKDAVAYWKKYYGQVEGGGEFASELVKEHVKAQLEAELGKYRVKLARAYSLAYDMAERSMCNSDKGSIELQVDEIMKFDDASFDSLKKVVARYTVTGLRKAAGKLPYVGEIHASGGENTASTDEENPYSTLGSMLGNKKGSF